MAAVEDALDLRQHGLGIGMTAKSRPRGFKARQRKTVELEFDLDVAHGVGAGEFRIVEPQVSEGIVG